MFSEAGPRSAADRLLATRLGTAAADLVAASEFGYMVAARGQGTEPVPLKEVAGKVKLVPADHDWITAARKVVLGWVIDTERFGPRPYERLQGELPAE